MCLELLLLVLVLGDGSYGLFKEEANEHRVNYLHVDKPHVQEALTMFQTLYADKRLQIYCRRDQPLKPSNIFQSNSLQLISELPDMKYTQYLADTAEGVRRAHEEKDEYHEGKLLSHGSQRVHYITIPAHSHSCYGIYTDQAYNVTLLQDRCDMERVARFVAGLSLWLAEMFTAVGESLLCVYMVFGVLGVQMGCIIVVVGALFARGDRRLRGLRPVASNFKLVLEQYPTTVVLGMILCAWTLVHNCQEKRHMWRHRIVRSSFCHFLHFLAYMLIAGASNHAKFGWTCVALLFPWPELWWFAQWLRLQLIKLQRNVLPPNTRRLLSEQEFVAQSEYQTQHALSDLRLRIRTQTPDWEHLAQMRAPQQFARFLSSGVHNPGTQAKQEPNRSTQSRQVQTMGTESHMEQVTMQHISDVINDLEPTDSMEDFVDSSTESLYSHVNFGNSTRRDPDAPRRL